MPSFLIAISSWIAASLKCLNVLRNAASVCATTFHATFSSTSAGKPPAQSRLTCCCWCPPCQNEQQGQGARGREGAGAGP